MEPATIITHGMEYTIIHALLPGDTEYIGIRTPGGVFMLDLVMVGLDGVFILIIDAIGEPEVIDMVTDMVIAEDTITELVQGTGPAIEQGQEMQIEMFIEIALQV